MWPIESFQEGSSHAQRDMDVEETEEWEDMSLGFDKNYKWSMCNPTVRTGTHLNDSWVQSTHKQIGLF